MEAITAGHVAALRALAREAGAAIMAIYAGEHAVEIKK